MKTREGNLRIIADRPNGSSILGRSHSLNIQTDDDIDKPTTMAKEWDSPS
ncbi:MAG TPA: hypothetical protein PJ991_03460 [Kiritimatiellia bacterium]|nr:hypothetical protein [Kiritimatiellia bacterium]